MTRRGLFLSVLGVLFAARTSRAHHSTAMYDMANPKTVKGAVKRFEWTNPHAFLFIEVKDRKSTRLNSSH